MGNVVDSSVLVEGGVRLSHAEETALNLLLKREGGEEDGMPLYKISWALEDNHAQWDESSRIYKFDPLMLPICFHENQASYHLLAWEPPSEGLFEVERRMKREGALRPVGDSSKGQYNCLFHFLDSQGRPMNPTSRMIEIILPVMRQVNEIAFAARKGFQATLKQKRQEKIDRLKAREAKSQKDYEEYATDLLESQSPAFEGNPTSFPGAKAQSFSDLMPGERGRIGSHEPANTSTPAPDFVFSSRAPKRK